MPEIDQFLTSYWAHSLASHWRIAVYVPLGAVVGTEMLLLIPAAILLLQVAKAWSG